MTPIPALFRQRMNQAWVKGSRYVALIAKGLHFLPVFLLILIYFGYRAFLEWLPAHFPVYLLFTAIFTWSLSRTRIRTFVQPADPVFLFPNLAGLKIYFRRSLAYSAGMQSLKIFLLLSFLSPLYLTRLGDMAGLVASWAVLTVLKVWNVWIYWFELHHRDRPGTQRFLRWGSNGVITLWLFSGHFFGWPLLVAILWIGWLTLYHLKQQPPRHLIPWEALIIREQRTVSSYYRLAHQFIDVPYIGNEVKNRPALGFFYKWLPPTPENSYLYLYLRTFFRYREPFGVYIRLTLVTAAMMAFLRFEWWMAALTLAGGLYLTGVQLPWIRRIHRYQPWFRLYPRPVEQKQKDWSRLAVGLLAVQAVLILLPQWWLWQAPVTLLPLFLLLGWIIAWFLGRVYLPKRLHKKSSLL